MTSEPIICALVCPRLYPRHTRDISHASSIPVVSDKLITLLHTTQGENSFIALKRQTRFLVISPEMTYKTGRSNVRTCGVDIFKKLRDRLAD